MKYLSILLISTLLLSGCKKKDEVDQVAVDEELMLQYIEDNNLEMIKHEQGIYYHIEKPGVGGHPSIMNRIKITYTGYFMDGTIFDQAESPVTLNLIELIPGWRIGIPLLQQNGKGKFIIPSRLGYGSRDYGVVPANSILIFEITLMEYF